jgi:endogenous inhibitor of DNA gyrase (YacG/DUF329 family)
MGNTTRKRLDRTKQAMSLLRSHRKRTGQCLSGCGKRAQSRQLYCGECLKDKRDDKKQRKDKRTFMGSCPRCGEQKLFLQPPQARPFCFSTACIAELYRYQHKKKKIPVPSQKDAVDRFLGVFLGIGMRISRCDNREHLRLWVQSWVQLEAHFQLKMVRKLRQINESVDGYEPEGREFESLRARHFLPFRRSSCYRVATAGLTCFSLRDLQHFCTQLHWTHGTRGSQRPPPANVEPGTPWLLLPRGN